MARQLATTLSASESALNRADSCWRVVNIWVSKSFCTRAHQSDAGSWSVPPPPLPGVDCGEVVATGSTMFFVILKHDIGN